MAPLQRVILPHRALLEGSRVCGCWGTVMWRSATRLCTQIGLLSSQVSGQQTNHCRGLSYEIEISRWKARPTNWYVWTILSHCKHPLTTLGHKKIVINTLQTVCLTPAALYTLRRLAPQSFGPILFITDCMASKAAVIPVDRKSAGGFPV